MSYIQIQWTASNEKEAREIAKALLEKKWIACANLIPNVRSLYIWEGKIEEDIEIKVFLKTLDHHFTKICEYIRKNASYDVPEVGKVEITDSNPEYVQWLNENLSNHTYD